MWKYIFTLENVVVIATYILLMLGMWREAWSKRKKTLTGFGWVVASIGFLLLIISIYQNTQTKREIDLQNKEKQIVVISAYERLHSILKERLFPFHVLSEYIFAKYKIIKSESDFYPIFNNIKSEKFLYYLDSVDMNENMYLQSLPDSWKEGFAKSTEIFQNKLQYLLNSNQAFDAETISILNHVLEHEPVMNNWVKKELEFENLMRTEISDILGTSSEDYIIYIDNLKRLFEIIYQKVPQDKLSNGRLLYH